MNLDHLAYIVDVSKTKSLSMSAKNLHISVSAISQAINNLEEEFGFKIFTRLRQGTIPTSEGEKLIEKSLNVLAHAEKLKQLAINNNEIQKEITIATVPGLMHYIVNLIKLIKAENPKSKIRVHGKNSLEILNDVKENKLRFGLIWIYDELIKRNKELVFDIFQEVKINVCVSKNHILAEYKQVTIDDLKNEAFVVNDEQYLKWYYDEFLKDKTEILFTTNNIDSIRSAVNENIAITIGTDFVVQNEPLIQSGEAIAIELINPFHRPFYVGCIRNVNLPLSESDKKYINELKNEFERRSNR
ncbi:LysR family transcriptional regulator [Gottfriedia acidiceleris]|uniref:LysR family transcriptional regulator n=1 Tax=Gottfriedia acidiceleris TaxID=371036 RepID=A0ABY4JKL3_9BACI|nr:LysR family transcriptional regulator [Gottfriedia acidiceleris]UPM53378.1 LysR family transcriptional regulator [Gottfriedia acidiceleris]